MNLCLFSSYGHCHDLLVSVLSLSKICLTSGFHFQNSWGAFFLLLICLYLLDICVALQFFLTCCFHTCCMILLTKRKHGMLFILVVSFLDNDLGFLCFALKTKNKKEVFSERYLLHKLDHWAWMTSTLLCLGGLQYEVCASGLGFWLYCASCQGKGTKEVNILISIFVFLAYVHRFSPKKL